MTQRAAELIKSLERHPFQPGKSIEDYAAMLTEWTGLAPGFGKIPRKGVELIVRAIYDAYKHFPELISVLKMLYSQSVMMAECKESALALSKSCEFRNRLIQSVVLYDLSFAKKERNHDVISPSASLERTNKWKSADTIARRRILNKSFIERTLLNLANKYIHKKYNKTNSFAYYEYSMKAIILKKYVCEDIDAFNTLYDRRVEISDSPKTDQEPLYCLMMHEIGHAISRLLKLEKFDDLIRIYKQSENIMIRELSSYALTNFDEFIAEAWMEYQCSKSPRNLARDVGKFIEGIYANKSFPDDLFFDTSPSDGGHTSMDDAFALMDVPTSLVTEDMCRKAVRRNGHNLRFVPERLKSLDMCIEAVRNCHSSAKYVPQRMRTAEFFLNAGMDAVDFLKYAPETMLTSDLCYKVVVELGNFAEFKHVPDELMTSEICSRAVAACGENLAFVPDRLKTYEMCADAVSYDGRMLKHVPERLKAPELFLQAIGNRPEVIASLPAEMRTEEICYRAVMQDGRMLKHVPTEKRSAELCLEAVKDTVEALGAVPKNILTEKLCIRAVQRWSNWFSGKPALTFVPKSMRTKEVCLEAVRMDGRCMGHVPNEMKTLDICLEYLDNFTRPCPHRALKCPDWNLIPDELKTQDLYLAAVTKGLPLKDIPEEERAEAICAEAIKKRGWDELKYVPEGMKSYESCMDAVRQNGSALKYVPLKLKSTEMCLAAVTESATAILYVPSDMLNKDICRKAVAMNGEVLRFIPTSLCDVSLCLESVRQRGWNLEFVPAEMRSLEIYAEAVHQNPACMELVPKHLRYEVEATIKNRKGFLYVKLR